MNNRYYFDNQDDMDDETYQWLDSDFADAKKVHMGKLPRQRGQRRSDAEARRSARRAKRDWSRIH